MGCSIHILSLDERVFCRKCDSDYCDKCVKKNELVLVPRGFGDRQSSCQTCPWCSRDEEKKTPLVGRPGVHAALLIIDEELGLENDSKGQDLLMKVRERIRKYETNWDKEPQMEKKKQKKTEAK
jgi:hypothetical protein